MSTLSSTGCARPAESGAARSCLTPGAALCWAGLRTTLVQRSRDHYRRTWREEPLEPDDNIAPAPSVAAPAELTRLTAAVARALRELAAEDRFLLSAYFLDRQTLLQIARTLHVHEAAISAGSSGWPRLWRKQLVRQFWLQAA